MSDAFAPMKILIVTNMYPTDERPGYGTFVGSQVQSLRDAGHQLDVLFIQSDKTKWEYLRAFRRVHAMCRENRYDVVHAHYGLSAFPCLLQPYSPLVISYCGSDVFGHTDVAGRATMKSSILAFFQRQIGRFAAQVIVKSNEMKQHLPKSVQAKTSEVPNGVSFSRFRPGNQTAARKSMGLEPDVFYALFPYAPDRDRKNYRLLKDAIGILEAEGCKVAPLTIFEKTPDYLAEAMRAADCLALTSYWEGSPNAIKEAMASNLPVVATDVGDIRWLLGDTEGCYVSSFDKREYADVLRKLVKRGQKRTNGREIIAHLSLEKVAQKVARIYDMARSKGKHANPP